MNKTKNNGVNIAIALVLSSFVIVWAYPKAVSAFKPTPSVAANPGDYTHHSITEQAIKELFEIERIVPEITKLTPGMKAAINQIKEGNSDTDMSVRYFYDEPHFTGERFAGGKAYMDYHYNRITTGLSRKASDDVLNARDSLGTIFHAMQDFHSHSNWVELSNFSPPTNLGIQGPAFTNTAGPLENTCVNCITNGCSDLSAWVTTCNNNFNTGGKLTSGYFRPAPFSPFKRDGKCNHGGFGDFGICHFATGGTAKDSSGNASNHGYLHFAAAEMAKEATKIYIRDLKTRISAEDFKLLFGIGRTFGIALDSTASMDPVIASVKIGIQNMMTGRLLSPSEFSPSPALFVLSVFNDDSLGPLTVTSDSAIFFQGLNSYPRTGDAGCPEAAWRGVRRALDHMDGGDLYVYTDASSNDAFLQDEAIAIAKKKSIKIHWLLNGSCSPIAASYIRSAEETGGQVIYYASSDATSATSYLDYTFGPSKANILTVDDFLGTNSTKSFTFPVDSTLSSLLVSVSGREAYNTFFSASAPPTIGNVILQRPNGTTVQSTDTGVSITPLANGKFIRISSPVTGTWSVTVSSGATTLGDFTVRASGDSKLSFDYFQFTELFGWPGHEGSKPISRNLSFSRKSAAWAEVEASLTSTVQFELRRRDGSAILPLQGPNLSLNQIQTPAGAASKTFLGEYNPFIFGSSASSATSYVYATGLDVNGIAYQRVWPRIITPRLFEILNPDPQELVPNQITSYDFRVQPIGFSGSAKVRVSSSLGYLLSATAIPEGSLPAQDLLQNPSLLLQHPGRIIRVQLRPPANAVLGSVDILALSVFTDSYLGDSDDSSSNSTYLKSVVVNTPDTIIPYTSCPLNLTITSVNGQPRPVTYSPPEVFDNRFGATVTCSPQSGSSFPVGTSTVNCVATDVAGNTGGCKFNVTVTGTPDNSPPVISNCPTQQVTSIPYGQGSGTVAYVVPQATDDRDGSIPVSCTPSAGSQFSRGTTIVSCSATDSAGNQSTCSFSVKVFDVVIQDDGSGDTLLFNSITGDYIFYRCGVNSFTLTGKGTISRQGCLVKLGGDPKVSATLDSCLISPANRGSATIKPNPIGGWFYLTDSNTTNNTRICPN